MTPEILEFRSISWFFLLTCSLNGNPFWKPGLISGPFQTGTCWVAQPCFLHFGSRRNARWPRDVRCKRWNIPLRPGIPSGKFSGIQLKWATFFCWHEWILSKREDETWDLTIFYIKKNQFFHLVLSIFWKLVCILSNRFLKILKGGGDSPILP